jgi:hypothetical protein
VIVGAQQAQQHWTPQVPEIHSSRTLRKVLFELIVPPAGVPEFLRRADNFVLAGHW